MGILNRILRDDVGDYINKKMLQRGLTVASLARKAAVSRQSVYNALDGKCGQAALTRIINVLHIAPENILRQDDHARSLNARSKRTTQRR